MRKFLPAHERLLLDGVQKLFLNHIVIYHQEGLAEFLQSFLHCYLVDNGISIQPLNFLVNFDENTRPVGCKLQFILCTRSFLLGNL